MSPTVEASNAHTRSLPPVLGRMLGGTFWLALRSPLQVLFAFWSLRIMLSTIGDATMGAYGFAWGFGFLQFLLEFGMGSALQRQISDSWTRGDRAGVERSIACGLSFYAAMACIQILALFLIAKYALPLSRYYGSSTYSLIQNLLILQMATAPVFGLSTVVSSVLQAARRYDFLPRIDLAIVTLRFLILAVGLSVGVDFLAVVITQTVVQIALSLLPSLWVVTHELGFRLSFFGARRADFAGLLQLSSYMFLIQLSVVLADKIDTTILGYALQDPGPATAVYRVVSTPFLQIRQTAWSLTYFIMPAVASLIAARDDAGLERVKYDGPRLHIGVLAPLVLLAFLFAKPFLALCIGNGLGDLDPVVRLWRLFLVATIPLVISVFVQMSIGFGKIRVIALAALAGSLVNLPISYFLTLRLGVEGVIWGTVLTTLFSNLIAPGIYVFRELRVSVPTLLTRSLASPAAGALALIVATWLARLAIPPVPVRGGFTLRAAVLIAHLSFGVITYTLGYLAVPAGRGDLALLKQRFLRAKT